MGSAEEKTPRSIRGNKKRSPKRLFLILHSPCKKRQLRPEWPVSHRHGVSLLNTLLKFYFKDITQNTLQ